MVKPAIIGAYGPNIIGSAFRSRPVASAVARRSAARSRSNLTPIMILVQRHAYSTETSSSSSNSAYPPPGFNAEQAKKPLPKDTSKESENVEKGTSDVESVIKEIRAEVDSVKPTGEAKTEALAGVSLTELATEKAKEEAKLSKKEKEAKKLTLWQKVKKEAHHYWDGTKLLAMEVKISSKLALKMAAGYELTRRENRQLQRTVQDLGRLVPFSVFVIVPFAELLLPVALKLFPNLLPSTYEGQKSKDAKAANLRATRKEVSNFLRDTLKETGLPVSAVNAQREEFTEFFRKVRATGESPTQEDVIKVCKIFKDDLTLDNLSRPQLVGICRYMNLNTFGTDMMLRYQIRHRMRQIKRDDRAISYEGVDSLSVPELQMACASRGLRTHGVSPARLRDDLQMWLDLRLKYGVPSTLLVMSNAFMYAQGKDSEISSQIDALQAVLSSIPEELFHEIELEVHNAEGAATNKQRLEVLKEQQELIEEENEQNESNESAGQTPKDDANIDEHEERRTDSKEVEEKQASEASEAEQDATKQQQASENGKEQKKEDKD
jgi:LETM1 and EF-hand domain-containing protein 1, mitochondrial